MKAVILEDYAIQQGDLDWSGVEALVPDVTRYGRTAPEEVVPRIGDAEIVFLNKCRIDETVLARCPKLRWVGIIATGTDNLGLPPPWRGCGQCAGLFYAQCGADDLQPAADHLPVCRPL